MCEHPMTTYFQQPSGEGDGGKYARTLGKEGSNVAKALGMVGVPVSGENLTTNELKFSRAV